MSDQLLFWRENALQEIGPRQSYVYGNGETVVGLFIGYKRVEN